MTDVFISYKSQREEHARRFAVIFEAAGYDVWWAPSRIKPGKSFGSQIQDALNATKAIVVLWCSASCSSRYVLHEAHEGINEGKLIQCALEKSIIKDKKLPMGMQLDQCEDLSDWNGSIHDERIERVLAAVEEKVMRPRRLTPDLTKVLSRALGPLSAVLPLSEPAEPCSAAAPPTDLSPADFKALNTADKLEVYVTQYPAGAFVAQAQEQIQKLDAAWIAQLNITQDDWRLSTRRQIIDKVGDTASRADLEPRARRDSAEAATLLGLQAEAARDATQASDLYARAANLGFARAQILYADTLAEKGPDYHAACMLWAQASADQHNPWGQNLVGVNYQKGRGVEKDNAQAAAWYAKAADQGLAVAQGNLALLLRYGFGLVKDLAKALDWYRKGAAQDDIESQYGLSMMLLNGEGVSDDNKDAALLEAIEWLSKAADAGHARSEACLADLLERGLGGEKNLKAAFDRCLKAAKAGLPDAQFQTGRMYEHGIGVEKDLSKALEWYEKAALEGHAEAQKALARLT